MAPGRATSPELKALVKWWAEGTAAGNAGDGYENRDRGHSPFDLATMPQIERVVPDPRRGDYGLSLGLRPGVTVANSSTARAVTQGGSNPRTMYSSRDLLTVLSFQYRSNYLQIHPEHLDHDPGRNGVLGGGWGDLLPANTPYLLTSQGSSLSDQVFVRAAFTTLAAFRPEAKRRLAENGALMPALQMLFRLCATNVGGAERYLAPGAHPVVFDGTSVDAMKMAELAHSMMPDAVPPVAVVRVVEEDREGRGGIFVGGERGEALADTPGAVARIWRGTGGRRRMVLSADASFDVNDRALSFRWVTTQGPPGKTTIRPLNDRGSVVEVVFQWHGWEPVPPAGRIESTRQDLAVFVSNGAWWSAPAFVTWYANPRERREYDATGHWLDIGYDGGSAAVRVAYLTPVTDWLLGGSAGAAGTAFLQLAGTDVMAAVFAASPEVQPFEEVALARRREADAARAHLGAIEATLIRAKAGPGADAGRVAQLESELHKASGDWVRAQDGAAAAEATARVANRDPTRRLEERVREWIHSPDLVATNSTTWAPLFAAAPPEVRKRIEAARDKAERWGLKAGGEGRFVPGVAPRFTAVEMQILAEYHAVLLRELVLPPAVEAVFASDYADERVFPPLRWRDVARRGGDGTLLGWRRYSDEAPRDFAWDGRWIVERDERGRPTRTRDVTYRREGGTVAVAWGATTNVMVYEGPEDFRGRVRR